MGGGEGAKGNLKNEEAEQAGSLEPDPRYIRCCSAVCRPGYALRDALLGLLVLLGLSVVVTVIFVVCFYVIPDEKQLIDEGILAATAKGVIRGPEHLNEVTLQEGDKYSLPPHNFEDDHSLDESVDPQQDLPQDFSTFAPPSGEMKDTTDPTMLLQDENQDAMFGQDSPIEHHEEILSDEVLQPRENFDIHLLEESNIPEPEPSDGLHEEPEVHNEHGHSQGSQDQEHHGSQVHHEESVDYVALPDEENQGCTAVQLPMCISSVPWTMTGSPNWMAHTSEEEMFAALPYIRSSLLDSGCSSLAPLFACSILEPPCQNSKVLPPCRAFCEEVAQSCQSFIQGASLPGLFHCARYPDSADPSVCISAQQECSGDDDFRCATTGLCVPSSWLCDGADDCRDNSDEQNCPLTPGNDRSPTENTGGDEIGRTSDYEDPEYSNSNVDHVNENYHAESAGIRIPPLGYPQFDSEDASTINDPALAGPSLNDPALLEAAYRHENEEHDNVPYFESNAPQHETSEQATSSAEIAGIDQYSQEDSISSPDHSRRRRPSIEKNIQNRDDFNVPDLVDSDGFEISANPEYVSSNKEEDLYSDYSVRNDHFQNHPIPDVDYPAKETFSVDSTSSVDQKFHRISSDKNEDDLVHRGEDEHRFQEDVAADTVEDSDSNTADVKTPSQRLRERLTGVNRRRQNANQVTRRQRPASNTAQIDGEELSTVEPPPRSTRPPSRLANFQDRFREWRDKRRPTLPSDLQGLNPGRISATAGTPGTGRPYDLVRRRPQRVTTPTSVEAERVELLREKVNRGNSERQESKEDRVEPSNIRQPITLPKTVIPDPNELNSESPNSRHTNEESIGMRHPRPRPGFRFRQQSRQRPDSDNENERPISDSSRVSENEENRYSTYEKHLPSEREPSNLPERELYGQSAFDETNSDQEPNLSYRPQNHPDQLLPEDPDHSNVEVGQEEKRQNIEANKGDEFYRQEVPDSISNSETHGSIPQDEPTNEEHYDYPSSELNIENEYPELQSQPSELHSQTDDSYYGRDSYQYSDDYGNHDDDAIYTQQNSEEEPYRPPEYRPQRTYDEQNYQSNQQQEPTAQADHRFAQSQATRPQGRRPSAEDNSQFNLPSNFRVSFPPPRSIRPRQQGQPQRPVRPHLPSAATSNSFYNRDDSIVSDIRYDVPAVNQAQYPTYQQPPPRRPDSYVSPYIELQDY